VAQLPPDATRCRSGAPHVLTVSESAKHRTVTDFGADPESIRVVHNGIDTELFEPVDRAPDPDPDRPRVMTTVSADVPLKGTRHLLEAFATVCETIDAELVVVGEFDEGGDCERLVSELGLADAIETHSEISYERMVELYGSADVAVVPSIYEGFGLPAGEALACGVPVVATTGGGFPKWSATPASSSNRAIRTRWPGPFATCSRTTSGAERSANRDESESSRSSTGSEPPGRPYRRTATLSRRANRGLRWRRSISTA